MHRLGSGQRPDRPRRRLRPHGEAAAGPCLGAEHLSAEDRVAKILDAGVDQLGGEDISDVIVSLVRSGRITEERIDRSVTRLLRVKFQLGLFDDPFVSEADADVVGADDLVAEGLARSGGP